MEIIRGQFENPLRRNKRDYPCLEDWKNYDDNIMEDHLKSVGCRTPYQKSQNNISVCSTKAKMEQAVFSMDKNQLSNHYLPCRTTENIQYNYKEMEWCLKNNCSKETRDVFSIGMTVFNRRFKEITQTKAIDIQVLIGNAGGYCGLFIGSALSELPDLISCFYKLIRKSM